MKCSNCPVSLLCYSRWLCHSGLSWCMDCKITSFWGPTILYHVNCERRTNVLIGIFTTDDYLRLVDDPVTKKENCLYVLSVCRRCKPETYAHLHNVDGLYLG